MSAPRQHHPHSRSESHGDCAPPPPPPPNAYAQYELPDPLCSAAVSGKCATDQFETPPAKRQRLSATLAADDEDQRSYLGALNPTSTATPARKGDMTSNSDLAALPARDAGTPGSATPATPGATTAKSNKRVRTGCLTCRERHLKCDEGLPSCLNCRKGSRECKRGIRLNFIDVQVKKPPHVPPTFEWSVHFQDESRLIASEYRGGLGRYAPFDQIEVTLPRDTGVDAALRRQQKTADNPELTSLFNASNKGPTLPNLQGMYYPRSERLGQGEHTGYADARMAQMPDLQSRSNSDAFLVSGQVQSVHHTTTDPGDFSLSIPQDQFAMKGGGLQRAHAYRTSDVSSVTSTLVSQDAASFQPGLTPGQLQGAHEGLMTPPSDKVSWERDCLGSDEEIHYMQVFINEVAIWMDSFDREKHFGRVIPYLALKSPMLLNAFLACGVKHMALVDKTFDDDKALFYYDTATTQLLRNLQNPDRNTAECATTAVVLNVYEIMSEKPTRRMSHIAGARALIRECGWDARSPGIGAACFWLNIGMEVLSCLSFNWQTAWDPDQWGMDLDFTTWVNGEGAGQGAAGNGGSGSGSGNLGVNQNSSSSSLGGNVDEEVWVHRMFYIVARIGNFRANIPQFQEPLPHNEQVRLQSRLAEYKHLQAMCHWWNSNCPRPMQPFGYSHTKPSGKSLFPNIWLVRRAAIIGRLFYHTAMCLLAQINPVSPRDSEENRAAQIHHARQVCGIVAHTKDHGVSSVAIRSLAIASSVLVEVDEQKEVLYILERISTDTGWRLGKVCTDLKKAWGWEAKGLSMMAPIAPAPPRGQGYTMPQPPDYGLQPSNSLQSLPTPQSDKTYITTATSSAPVAVPAPARPPVNPLLVQADFSLPNHPYQNWYEPPNRTNGFNSQGFWEG